MKKSLVLLAEVDIQLKHHFYSTAINRLYYSCYHITKALLLIKDLIPKTHSGVIVMLNQHFVLQKQFKSEQAAFFSKLMHERIDDDYSDFLVIDFEEIKEFIEPAKEYIKYVEEIISAYLEE